MRKKIDTPEVEIGPLEVSVAVDLKKNLEL
jgi:hypothetical protein